MSKRSRRAGRLERDARAWDRVNDRRRKRELPERQSVEYDALDVAHGETPLPAWVPRRMRRGR